MKILIINSVYDYGSTGKIVHEAANYLRANGHEVVTAFGRHLNQVPKNEPDVKRIGNVLDIALSGATARLFDSDGFVNKHATAKFLKWCDEYNPDIVWAHNFHGYYFNAGLLFDWLKKSNAKLVWTLHDCWSFTGHCACYSAVGCQGFLCECKKCLHNETYPKSLFSHSARNYSLKKSTFLATQKKMVLVAPSMWLCDELKLSFFASQRIEVIHNGIDLNIFKPHEKDQIKTPNSILCVANIWTKNKGLDDIIKLSKIVGQNWKISLIGDLPKGTVLPESIRYIKRTGSKEELVNLYASHEILFNPTYEDNFPTVNIEAIACHCVPVCYRIGGIPEIVPEDFLVIPGDFKAAYQKMELISSGNLKFDYSSREELSKEKTCQKYEKLFLSLMKQ